MDTDVQVALIGGAVTLIVAGVAGIYTLIERQKRSGAAQKEQIIAERTKSVLSARDAFLDAFREFEVELVAINEANPQDGTKAVQFGVDFFAGTAREFYNRNRGTLRTRELDALLA